MSDRKIINQINQEFREILEKMDTPTAPASDILDNANKQFHERGCVINVGKGDDVVRKPFPVFIMPYFMTRREMNEVERISNHIMNVLEKVTELYFVDPKFKPMFNLTERETECLFWASDGKTSGEIACILGITERTVNYHLNQVTRKTGSMNRYQAIAKGVSSGILLPNLEQVVVTNFPRLLQ